jgi:cyclopropane fatty-acyl-phospholipid synthase-like methyltransferase
VAVERIPEGADVLELGCGAGLPMTARLAESRRLTGVDISPEQVERARRNVPNATFIAADMTALDLEAGSFDAVVAFYAFTHVPREELPGLLGRIRDWLRPGGLLIATMGVEDDPGTVEPDWLGVEMYFSHFSARRNRRVVEEAGFQVDEAEVRAEPGDRHGTRFLWVVARAPADRVGRR